MAWTRGRMAVLGAALTMATPLCAGSAEASYVSRYARYAYGVLQCVPFARANSGIELVGNAATWWNSAVGVYERGNRPEVGSVLNFRGTRWMPLGHVAVVSAVVDGRTVQIDHANWSGRGVITRNVTVADVSPLNDWTAVRVEMGNGELGSVYPTYGFIYDRPDRGTVVANTGVAPRAPLFNAASAAAPAVLTPALDLRPPSSAGVLVTVPDEEVAEAADDAPVTRARRARPVVHYGRNAFARLDRRSGLIGGGRVLFVGRTDLRGDAGLVRPVSARFSRVEHLAQPAAARSSRTHRSRRG